MALRSSRDIGFAAPEEAVVVDAVADGDAADGDDAVDAVDAGAAAAGCPKIADAMLLKILMVALLVVF
jgi:hypothetical protein